MFWAFSSSRLFWFYFLVRYWRSLIQVKAYFLRLQLTITVTGTAALDVTGCQECLVPLPEAGASSSFAEGFFCSGLRAVAPGEGATGGSVQAT